jgi:hypothetical protein
MYNIETESFDLTELSYRALAIVHCTHLLLEFSMLMFGCRRHFCALESLVRLQSPLKGRL